MKNEHIIKNIILGSIAEEMEIQPGDRLLSINEHEIQDIFDYQFLMKDEYITVVIEKSDGEQWELEIEKDYEEDLGVEFEQPLLDDYRSCRNQCVFCFIDQMPKGMRETLYFKDDDSRLSFLQGNYVTLTNMSDSDIERIIRFKLDPINISVHTTNEELRCQMLHNRFAGEALKKMYQLYEAKIFMNSQIVLCKGYNDKEELKRTVSDLMKLQPYMKSLSVVPVGLTKFREGLAPLEKFTKEDCLEVIQCVETLQKESLEKYGSRFVYCSDEWYIEAGLSIPENDFYEEFSQMENGVGMVRSFLDEFHDYLKECKGDSQKETHVSVITGVLFSGFLTECVKEIKTFYPNMQIDIHAIKNNFFGENITVTGLITGADILEQCKGETLGDFLLLPETVLRSGESVLLDDVTVEDIEKTLQIPVHIVKSNGKSFLQEVLGEESENHDSKQDYELKEIN